MFYGMFRKSNLMPDTSKGFVRENQFVRSDFTMDAKYVSVHVKYSKTIQYKERNYIVKMPVTDTSLCPKAALLAAFASVTLPKDAPAFVANGVGQPLTGQSFNRKLKSLLSALGLDPVKYGSHSFRRGSATWALSSGIPGEVVKQMGDWRSAVYMDYLDHCPQKVYDHYVDLFASKLPC